MQGEEHDRRDDPGQQRTKPQCAAAASASSEPRLLEHRAGGVGQRAGQVGEALHAACPCHSPASARRGRPAAPPRARRAASPCRSRRAWPGRTRRARAPARRRCAAPGQPKERPCDGDSEVSSTTVRPSGSLLSAETPWIAMFILAAGAEAHARRPVGQLQLALDADGGEILLHHLGGVLVHAELRGREQRRLEAVGIAGLGEQRLRALRIIVPACATAPCPTRACPRRSARPRAACRGRRRRP